MDLVRLLALGVLAAPPLFITAFCSFRRMAAQREAFDRLARRLEDGGLILGRASRDDWHFTGSWRGYPVSIAIVKRYISSDYHACTEIRLTAPAELGQAVVYARRFDLPRDVATRLGELPAAQLGSELDKSFRAHAAAGAELEARLSSDLRGALLGFDGLVSLDAEGAHITVALHGIELGAERIEAALDLAAAYIEPSPVSAPARSPRGFRSLSLWGLGTAAVFLSFWPALLLTQLTQVARHVPSADPAVQFLAIFDILYVPVIAVVAIVGWRARPTPRGT